MQAVILYTSRNCRVLESANLKQQESNMHSAYSRTSADVKSKLPFWVWKKNHKKKNLVISFM